MTDAHFHRCGYDTFLSLGDREYRFFGLHPWQVHAEGDEWMSPDGKGLREALAVDVHAGVGEIGLDRLKSKAVTPAQRTVFAAQLEAAAEFHRPVVLHGAKCWGEVVSACRPYAGRIPAFLFHGFSRSGGLLPDIYALNGFVGVGAAILNDHAVNYRELVKVIAEDRLLVETDADYGRAGARPSQEGEAFTVEEILRKMAEVRETGAEELGAVVDANATRFVEALG